MKFKIAALCLGVMALSSVQLPSLADDVWFSKYDHNHDGHWDYNEFKSAHNAWYRKHHEGPRVTDVELRKQWDGLDSGHQGWVNADSVRTYHHWD